MNTVIHRYLRGYSLDPGFSTRLDTMAVNEITYKIKWEPTARGPVGSYFEVIDFDPASNCFYDPVDLDSREVMAENGLNPSEGNPKFHQQFVYLIAMKTLENFEKSLNRKIIWNPKVHMDPATRRVRKVDYVDRLRLYPHAFRDANAYYDPEKKAILFGYFEAASKIQDSNLPGGVIFSCLSPDIIAHEVTHAVLDSIHPRFIENTNPDVPAFHEGFADIVALLQRFSISPLVEHQIARTRGDLGKFSFLGELATQFGNALQNNRGALRGAIGKMNDKGEWVKYTPDPGAYQHEFEPHRRGALLVATIFDAFIRLYNVLTEDLIRIATNGSGILQPGAIHPDLVKRLAAAVCEIAEHLLHICIRALDYCPPFDITFGDYLRALITADLDTSPNDMNGYRVALIEAFRSWGIFPDRVNTLSIESLTWEKSRHFSRQENTILEQIAKFLKERVSNIIDLSSGEKSDRKKIYLAMQKVQAELHDMLIGKKRLFGDATGWAQFLKKLGLTNEPVRFSYQGEECRSRTAPKIEVHKVRPVYRVGRENIIVEQVLITLSQTFFIDSGRLKGARFRGGCSLILNISRDYAVDYIIHKKLRSQHRFEKQMDYQTGETGAFAALTSSLYEDDGNFEPLSFSHLHFHFST